MLMKHIFKIASILMVLAIITSAKAGTYTSDFNQYLSDNQSKDMVSAIITMADRVDLETLKAELYARNANRQEWHETMVRAFQDKATESQANILAKLDTFVKDGSVSSYNNYWLGNLIIVKASPEALNELVVRSDIDQIAPNYLIESIKDFEVNDEPNLTSSVEEGLTAIHADECWAMGITGEGRLVSHIDTGVRLAHEALTDRWRGNDSRYDDNPEWAWYDPISSTTSPFDANYHGTHTMGTICGLGESTGDTIGVAFGAEWISAGIMDRVSDLDQTLEYVIAALQWVADPDEDPSTVWDVPDVCSNSWGISPILHDIDECDETLWEAIDYAEAAGVVLVFAAGNEGSYGSESLRTPADRATTDLNCFAVGAIDAAVENYEIASFSSLGPSYCTDDGSEAIKPEIVAPGVDVRSAYAYGDYTTLSGTSMATPHIAGVVALMRQANPDLTSDQVKQILLNTAADLGDEGDDNSYGRGLVDAYAAVNMALSHVNGFGYLTGAITDLTTGDPIIGAAVSVVDGSWSTTSNSNGMYYLFIPADTAFNIQIEASGYVSLYDNQSIVEDETSYVDYELEPKVTTTFTVSFANGDEISYRNFYVKGSWNDDGSYDADWSGGLVALADDGESPDETAGDGIFTGQALLARDTDNSYSWSVYTENYGVNSIDDAYLASGSDFNITDFDPVDVPTLAPNPSGSDNNFRFSVEGDNGLFLDLNAGFDGDDYKWGTSTALNTGTTYIFKFYVMNGDEAIYGEGGVGGSEITFTPDVDYDTTYEIIYNDEEDSYLIQVSGTHGAPISLDATSGYDGHIPITWLTPGADLSTEIAYDDGIVDGGWCFLSTSNLIAVMFAPESYPVTIDSVMVHVVTEGDEGWDYDEQHYPTHVSVYLDDGTGYPADAPVFSTTVTPELGEWIRVDVDEIAVTSGYFWVATNTTSTTDYDMIAIDEGVDYVAHQWYRYSGTWSSGVVYDGDNMIRTKVFNNSASSWLAYDNAIVSKEVVTSVPTIGISEGTKSAGNIVSTVANYDAMTDISGKSTENVYYPHILSDAPVATEVEDVDIYGYNLYRSTGSGAYEQGMKINNDIITGYSYDDWGDDTYGPIHNGTKYYYQAATVYDVNGTYLEVGPSNETNATPANHPPSDVTNLTGEANGNDITLSWDANTDYDIAAYNIYYKTGNIENDNYSLFTTVDHPATSLTQTVEANIYYFNVKAVDADGAESEDYSNVVMLYMDNIPPNSLTASTDLEFQVELNWHSPASDEEDLISSTEQLNVALLIADVDGAGSEIMDYMMESGEVANYDVISVRNNTPTLSDLEPYDVALVWSNYGFSDNDSLGNVLADFVDQGKGVIAFAFSFGIGGFSLQGRIMDDYSPIQATNTTYDTTYLADYNEYSRLMDGVDELSDYFSADAEVQNDGIVVAYWENGYPAVAVAAEHSNFVCINAYVGGVPRRWGGDMLQLVHNAILYVTGDSGIYPDGYNLYRSLNEGGDYELITSLEGNEKKYLDTVELNATPYYYNLTAVYDGVESVPASVSGHGCNYSPEAPTDFTFTYENDTVVLGWAFTNLIGDFDHYNVYRRPYAGNDWTFVGSSETEEYTDDVTDIVDGVYIYAITAVDNGEPQLESAHSDSVQVSIGEILPPMDLGATSSQDGFVPLYWNPPAASANAVLAYDDGTPSFGAYFFNTSGMFAKQFTAVAPVDIRSLSLHVITEGDQTWPWPDRKHDPITISIWDDNGKSQPGAVIAETTIVCPAEEWINISFREPITSTTDNFWVSWNNTASGYDAIAFDEVCDNPEAEWYYNDGKWINGNLYDGDLMIRAAIDSDDLNETQINNGIVLNASELSLSEIAGDAEIRLLDTEDANLLGYYIYRSTSADVPIDDDYRITSDYVTETEYTDDDVTNGTTYYYIAVAVYNADGEISSSIASNETSATPKNPGMLTINPASLYAEVGINDSTKQVTRTLTLTNDGGLPIYFAASTSTDSSIVTSVSNVNYAVCSRNSGIQGNLNKSQSKPIKSDSPVITNSGGPDNYGYTWIDSNDEGGPEYNWVDINGTGELIWGTDEVINGPYTMDFDFSFYGTTYSSLYISDNGYISFTSDVSVNINVELPSGAEPYNMIAPAWFDMVPDWGGTIYYYTSSDTTIVTWQDLYDWNGLMFTYQIILTSDGNITFQYSYLDNGYGVFCATVGMQNGDGTDGLQISYCDDTYPSAGMAISIVLDKGWLSTDPTEGALAVGESMDVDVVIDGEDFELGTYTGDLVFSAYDMNHDLDPVSIPVTLDVVEVANQAPEAPTDLACTVNDYIVGLSWSFTNLDGDFDHFNIYRKIASDTNWSLLGSTTDSTYTDETIIEDNMYYYCVTAVDNDDHPLESAYSDSVEALVGNLPPQELTAISNQDSEVPLSWITPGVDTYATLAYDDGIVTNASYLHSNESILATEFTGTAPIEIKGADIRLITSGDELWPWPNSVHDPVRVTVWEDNDSGAPGALLGEIIAICNQGEWLNVRFAEPLTCTTANYWIGVNNTTSSYDGLALYDNSENAGNDWIYSAGQWNQNDLANGGQMIRAIAKSAGDDPQLYDTEEFIGYYIYRNTAENVPVDDNYRITSDYVTDTYYNDTEVTNGATYYYIVAAAYNMNGSVELSSASNEVSATPMTPGQLAVDPASINESADPGDAAFAVGLTLTNTGGLPVIFTAAVNTDDETILTDSDVDYLVQAGYTTVTSNNDKSNVIPDTTNLPIVANNGGPDEFGYTWVDSDDENGPVYNWIDITSDGVQITEFTDDSNLGPYDMGFDFPFYGTTYSTFRVCSNGWLSFTSDMTSFNNLELPSSDAPFNLIAPYWDDMNPEDGGEYYYYAANDSLVMSWIDVPTYTGGYELTFQIILTADGTITLQYGDLASDGSLATVGIQNTDGTDGLSIAYNASYVHDDMAIKIKTEWLSVSIASGTIAAGGSLALDAILDPRNLTSGDYAGTITFASADMNHELDAVGVPVTLLINVVGIDDDEIGSLPTVFSMDQNYPNPFNAHTEIKYALPVDSDVTLEIYNVLGQKVVTLVDEKQTAGYHSLIWDGTNESGQVVSSGMYLYKLVTDENTFVKKMVMLK